MCQGAAQVQLRCQCTGEEVGYYYGFVIAVIIVIGIDVVYLCNLFIILVIIVTITSRINIIITIDLVITTAIFSIITIIGFMFIITNAITLISIVMI